MEHCVQCGIRGDGDSIRRCSRCKTVRYCSRDCQARHWPHHRVTCKPEGSAPASGLRTEETGHHGDANNKDTLTVNPPPVPAVSQDSGGEASASGSAENFQMTCQNCKRKGNDFRRCVHCQKATYCSRDCQRGDWKVHKITCKAAINVTNSDAGLSSGKGQQGNTRTETETAASAEGRDRSTARWASLFRTLYDTETHTVPYQRDTSQRGPRQQDTWQRAKSKAEAAFPGIKVVTLFRDLDSTVVDSSAYVRPILEMFPMIPTDVITMEQSPYVLVVKTIGYFTIPMPFPVACFWVEDSQENKMVLPFTTDIEWQDIFSLETGVFVCLKHAKIGYINIGPPHPVIVMDDADSIKVLGY